MRNFYLVFIICLSNLVSAQNFAWAKSFGGNNNDAGLKEARKKYYQNNDYANQKIDP